MSESCHFGQDCPVFNDRMARLPGVAQLFRKRYCEVDHTRCARHRLAEAVGVTEVPDHLMPNDHDSAAVLFRGYAFPN